MTETFVTEMADVSSLRPHPQNYRSHPEDQLAQIAQSIKEHGFYKNVVIARDGTILAGHGAVLASRKLGIERIPVKRLDVDPFSTKAMKVIVGDNELARLGEVDDRALSEMLKNILDSEVDGLVGTGFDEQSLAAFLMVTRDKDEIADINEASEWIGMPEYDAVDFPFKVVVSCSTEEARDQFLKKVGAEPKFIHKTIGKTTTLWWPLKEKQDLSSIRFEQ